MPDRGPHLPEPRDPTRSEGLTKSQSATIRHHPDRYPDSPELDMVWVAFVDDIRLLRQVSADWLVTV